jgi:replicative DNA helicase
LLSCLLQDKKYWPAVESYHLTAADFEQTEHYRIYDTLRGMFREGRAVDLITLLDANSDIDAVVASDCLDGLADPAHLHDYVEYMVSASIRRRASRLIESLQDSPGPEVLEKMRDFVEANNRFRRGDAPSWEDDIADVVDNIITKEFRERCLDTGIAPLDRLLSGMRPGAVYIIAGRPGMGKTTLGCNIAMNITKGGQPAGIVSLEMGRHELIVRLLSELSGISGHGLQSGMIPHDQLPLLQQAEMELKTLPLHIVDNAPSTFAGVAAAAREMHRNHGIKCLFIDYLQLMRGDGHRGNREQEVASISRRVKELARELDIPIVSLSQLSRNPEKRDDKRPALSDLRESGSLEQDADVVMFLYRPGYYKQTPQNLDEAELIVSKNRHGATAIVSLLWDARTTRFTAAE